MRVIGQRMDVVVTDGLHVYGMSQHFLFDFISLREKLGL